MKKGIGAAFAVLAVLCALAGRLMFPGFAEEVGGRVDSVLNLSHGAKAIEAMGGKLLSNGVYGAVTEAFSAQGEELREVSTINKAQRGNIAP